MNWITAINDLTQRNEAFVIVTILAVEGSSPRAVQTKMIVDKDTIHDTIGGGNLEHKAIARARDLLSENRPALFRETFSLGKDLSQCCGGNVELLFEVFSTCDFNIVVVGAGHVGKALLHILRELPCRVIWVDSRQSQFPTQREFWDAATNVQQVVMDNPHSVIENCPDDAYYLVMTHSHEIDFELCEAILSRTDIRYCGLIGSKSKAAKFRNRLSRKAFNDTEINRLTSPVGLNDIPGKEPMAVAVSIAAQLLQQHGERTASQ